MPPKHEHPGSVRRWPKAAHRAKEEGQRRNMDGTSADDDDLSGKIGDE